MDLLERFVAGPRQSGQSMLVFHFDQLSSLQKADMRSGPKMEIHKQDENE